MASKEKKTESILILPDIRSAYNVGAMFRTADAAGVGKIYLTGITPAPVDRFGRPRKDVAKASLGAELSVPWEQKGAILPLIAKLRAEGYEIVAIEQSEDSVDYKKVKVAKKVAFVVGTEVSGLPKNVLSKCDIVAEIQMAGTKESLNVSVAAGIALFRILGR